MSRILILLVVLISALGLSCTAQDRAKNFGGTAEIKLPCGQKIIGATWKDDNDLWYLTRPFRPGEQAERVTFRQSKNLRLTGNGKVVFVECAD